MLVAQYLDYFLFGHARGPHTLTQTDPVIELVDVFRSFRFLERRKLRIPGNRRYQYAVFLHQLAELMLADLVPSVFLGYMAFLAVRVVVVNALYQAARLGVLDGLLHGAPCPIDS